MPTMPRTIAARFAPITPKAIRANTGNGTPYFCDGRPTRFISTLTMAMPTTIESSTCQPAMPRKNRLAANV